MRILVLRVIPAMTGIRPKHISHLGFVGGPTGSHWLRGYRVLPMASTDCGFSQNPLAGRVHRSIMWAKLKCLAEGAAIASKVLWH